MQIDDSIVLKMPPVISGGFLNEILDHGVNLGASDFHLMSSSPIKLDLKGRITQVTLRALQHNELMSLAKEIYEGDGVDTELFSAKAVDRAISVQLTKGRIRFRVNMVACQVKGRFGIQITLRTIDERPMTVEQLGVEQHIYEASFPSQGIVFITGPTGSGKSTLLSAMINSFAQQPNANKKIITLEAPIEYTYDHINNPSVVIAQTEIPTNQVNFEQGIEAALRRKPDIILVGEMRDRETIDAAFMASQTGHLVLATLHTNGVGASFRRLLTYYPQDEREEKMAALIDSTRLIVTQRLELTNDGGRKPLKEYLVFDKEVKDRLEDTDFKGVAGVLNEIVNERGTSMLHAAIKLRDQGLITDNQVKDVESSF